MGWGEERGGGNASSRKCTLVLLCHGPDGGDQAVAGDSRPAFALPSKYVPCFYLGLCPLSRLLPSIPNLEFVGSATGNGSRLPRAPPHMTRRATAARNVLHRISSFSCARRHCALLCPILVPVIRLLFADYGTEITGCRDRRVRLGTCVRHSAQTWTLEGCTGLNQKQMLDGYALRGNRTPGGSMATTQVTTTPLMLYMSLLYLV